MQNIDVEEPEVVEEEIVISAHVQRSMKSWFMVSAYAKILAIGYAGMLVLGLVFCFTHIGVDESWFWPKTMVLVIGSAAMLFISMTIRMIVYSGVSVPQLREQLTQRDDEKVIAANNFYIMITKLLLVPSITMALAAISLKDYLLKQDGAITQFAFGWILVALLIMNIVLLVRLYLYLASVRKDNKEVAELVNQKYQNQLQENT